MAILDAELESLLVKKDYYEKNPSHGSVRYKPDDLLFIKIKFTGKMPALQQAGFNLSSIIGPTAYGSTTIRGLASLSIHPQIVQIEKQSASPLCLNNSIPDIHANQLWSRNNDNFTGYTGKGVIVGIVDTGINFRHPAFQKADGTTRILKIWDQTINAPLNPPQGGETVPGPITDPLIATSPTPLGYGVEYSSFEINNAITNSGAGVKARHMDDNGHGTHVAGIAVGDGSQSGGCHGAYTYIGVAPAADIIMVRRWGLTRGDRGETQTPKQNNPPPNTSDGVQVDAIRYLLNEAKKLGQPLVINLSTGWITEFMDGTSIDCTAVDHLLTNNSTGRAVVFAAGNDGNNSYHAAGNVPPGSVIETVHFTIAEDDTTPRTIVLLYTGSNLQAQVTSPVSGAAGVITWVSSGGAPGTSNTANGPGTNSMVTVSNSPNRIAITITPPVTGTPPVNSNNKDGTWTLELRSTAVTPTAFHIICNKSNDHDATSSYFKDHVSAGSTLSETATGFETIAVGSCKTGGPLSDFSSRGPTLDAGVRNKPDLCAPGDNISSTAISSNYDGCHLCCCDCCHDFYVDKSGTSMAAPHVAGAIALMLHKNPSLTHTQITQLITNNAGPRNPVPPSAGDAPGWGFGRLDIKNTMDHVTQVNAPVAIVATQADQLTMLREEFMATPRASEFAGLFGKYFNELKILVNNNKRVATVWHRCRGPVWIRLALRAAYVPDAPLPMEAAGLTFKECAQRMMDVLKRYASTAFLRDMRKYEAELDLFSTGMTLKEMIQLIGRQQDMTNSPLHTENAW